MLFPKIARHLLIAQQFVYRDSFTITIIIGRHRLNLIGNSCIPKSQKCITIKISTSQETQFTTSVDQMTRDRRIRPVVLGDTPNGLSETLYPFLAHPGQSRTTIQGDMVGRFRRTAVEIM